MCYRVLRIDSFVRFFDGSSFGYGKIVDRGCDGSVDFVVGTLSPCPVQGVSLRSCEQRYTTSGSIAAKFQVLFDTSEREKRFERSCTPLAEYEY